jgi:hypothetical protein
LIAFSGKYRSPVSLERFPDLVVHFWAVQDLRERWLFARPLTYLYPPPEAL